MKVFLVTFNGHYLGGQMIVVSETKRKAFNRAKKKIEEIGLADQNKDLSIEDVLEIETDKENIIVIDDGNY